MNARHQFAELAEECLRITTLPPLPHHEPTMLAVGLLGRSRRLFSALLHLDDAGLADCGDSIIRSIIEHCCTGVWLLEDPEKRHEIVVRARLKDLRVLEAEGAVSDERATLKAYVEHHWGEPEKEMQLPPLDQRMIGPFKERYVFYRRLCELMHSSVASAVRGVSVAGGQMQEHVKRIRFHDAAFLVAGATHIWALAQRVLAFHHMPQVETVANFASRFIAYGEEGRQGCWILGAAEEAPGNPGIDANGIAIVEAYTYRGDH
jgi:hypothetical protein